MQMCNLEINFYPILINQREHFTKMVNDILISIFPDNPRPQEMSKSVYFVFLAIQVLEKLGNTYPSQEEIDSMELLVKRFLKKAQH